MIVIKIIITIIILPILIIIAIVIIIRTSAQILTMPSKKFKKTSYRPTLPHQVQRNKGTKNRDLQTLSGTLSQREP